MEQQLVFHLLSGLVYFAGTFTVEDTGSHFVAYALLNPEGEKSEMVLVCMYFRKNSPAYDKKLLHDRPTSFV